jgi:hypothetical protein
MREVAHERARFGEEVEVFRSSFFDSGFRATRAKRKKIGGDEREHIVDEAQLFSRRRGSGVDDVGEVGGRCRGGAFES